MKRLFLYTIMTVIATVAMADKVGTWKVYPSYSSVQEVQENSADIYVLADGNLFSYHKSDESLTAYVKQGATTATGHSVDVLSSSIISHIAWVPGAKKLIIVYSDHMIDIMDADANVGHIAALKNSTESFEKQVDSIYVSGKFAFLRTADKIIKVDATNEYITKTFNIQDTIPADMPAQSVTPTKKTIPAYTHAKPDGAAFPEHYYITYDNGRILSVRGIYGQSAEVDSPGDVQVYDIATSTWSTYDRSYATAKKKPYILNTEIAVDPRDKNHVMVASRTGLFEYQDGKLIKYYDSTTDDPIISCVNSAYYSIVSGVKYDSAGNLWVFNTGQTKILCLTASGEWKTYSHSQLITGVTQYFKRGYIDSRGLLWAVNEYYEGNKLLVYDIQNDKMYAMSKFTNQDGKEILTNYWFFSVTEDLNNNMWFSTQAGCFYLTPTDITNLLNGVDPTKIQVTQPKISRNDGTGLADYLLDNVYMKEMEVGPANRKWFATGEGVYLISSDCNTQLEHFTTDNSPLISDEVMNIAIDESTGVIYIATLNGLCSYQSDITPTYGDLSESRVYAYPNPVTPDFLGDITIMGLTVGCNVKIVTPTGYVVNSGVCNNISYTWDGCDGNGDKVASGVYSILISDSQGSESCVTKIAIVK